MQAAREQCANLERDFQQALVREQELNTRLESSARELASVTQQLEAAGLALEQERAQTKQAWAELDFLSSVKAKEDEELERRWDAMIKRIR
jgi:predicted  nucleic acid-binding Zn-ribbon protein